MHFLVRLKMPRERVPRSTDINSRRKLKPAVPLFRGNKYGLERGRVKRAVHGTPELLIARVVPTLCGLMIALCFGNDEVLA